jgi:hypothetical protein
VEVIELLGVGAHGLEGKWGQRKKNEKSYLTRGTSRAIRGCGV